MTLNQALALIRANSHHPAGKTHFLACGFQPLHLKTFLTAHLTQRVPNHSVQVLEGAYGDLAGNLALAAGSEAVGAAVIVEWSDLDPRLGLRASVRWTPGIEEDILQSCRVSCARLEAEIQKLAAVMPVALCPPQLPVATLGLTAPPQASGFELYLREIEAGFCARLATVRGVRVVRVDGEERDRLDARMELMAGFPYKPLFASKMAEALSQALWPNPARKGLITDLDDTLWAGLVGEVGADQVSWHQDSHTQIHGLYQQFLGRLAGEGVLLAVASKNEAAIVEQALGRADLLLEPGSLFPVEANWGPKSASVARILKAWNIAPDAVVFVDDNPMELAEVEQAYPDILCRQFTRKDPDRVLGLLEELRAVFGKAERREEDRLRQASIRAAAEFAEQAAATPNEEFLATLDGQISIDWRVGADSGRALELINKTNQFNLNGKRIAEGEWNRLLADSLCGVVSYQDKFGALGRIAVIVAQPKQQTADVLYWVMSCRAFSRRIEHHTLAALLRKCGAERLRFDCLVTERNQPLVAFLESLELTPQAGQPVELEQKEYLKLCGVLPHKEVDINE